MNPDDVVLMHIKDFILFTLEEFTYLSSGVSLTYQKKKKEKKKKKKRKKEEEEEEEKED